MDAERIDDYILDGEIGRGTMGVVYRATHQFTQRTVALKILSAEVADSDMGAERFRREVSVSARVDDDGIVEVYDAGRFEDTFYYAMELLEGEELEERMSLLEVDEGLEYVADAAETLASCHDAGIIHRDLKPENIFLPDDRPGTKLLDFGVAIVRDAARATQAGFTLGTPYYMSPEQARDAREARPESDVWSLGVIVYELVTGELPFTGETAVSVMMSVVEDPPKPIPDEVQLPDDLRGILARSLAKDPDDRFDDSSAFASALRAVDLPADRAARSSPPPDPSGGAAESSVPEESAGIAATLGAGEAGTSSSGLDAETVGGGPPGRDATDEASDSARRAAPNRAHTEEVDVAEVESAGAGTNWRSYPLGAAAVVALAATVVGAVVWGSMGASPKSSETETATNTESARDAGAAFRGSRPRARRRARGVVARSRANAVMEGSRTRAETSAREAERSGTAESVEGETERPDADGSKGVEQGASGTPSGGRTGGRAAERTGSGSSSDAGGSTGGAGSAAVAGEGEGGRESGSDGGGERSDEEDPSEPESAAAAAGTSEGSRAASEGSADSPAPKEGEGDGATGGMLREPGELLESDSIDSDQSSASGADGPGEAGSTDPESVDSPGAPAQTDEPESSDQTEPEDPGSNDTETGGASSKESSGGDSPERDSSGDGAPGEDSSGEESSDSDDEREESKDPGFINF